MRFHCIEHPRLDSMLQTAFGCIPVSHSTSSSIISTLKLLAGVANFAPLQCLLCASQGALKAGYRTPAASSLPGCMGTFSEFGEPRKMIRGTTSMELEVALGVLFRTVRRLHLLSLLNLVFCLNCLDHLQWKFRLSAAPRWIDWFSSLLVRTSWP